MTCDELASTGQPTVNLLIIAMTAVLVGTILVLLSHTRRARMAVLAIAVLAAGGVIAGSSAPVAAQARQPICGHAGDSGGLTIEQPSPEQPSPASRGSGESPFEIGQISTNVGIAPGAAAAPITGRIVNRGREAIFVEAITVDIGVVVKALGAAPGNCDATDYLLSDPIMPMGIMLQPGESAEFSGASIGFWNKPLNQDACQAAIVRLEYFSS